MGRLGSVPRKPHAKSSPCFLCSARHTCRKPCPRLEDLLPGAWVGGHVAPIPPDIADDAGHWRKDVGQGKREVFRILLAHRQALTQRQWRCVELVYGEGLGLRQAGRALGVSHATVAQHVTAAAKRLLRSVPASRCSSGETHRRGGVAS